MKKLLLLLIAVASFVACKRCKTCVTEVTYKTQPEAYLYLAPPNATYSNEECGGALKEADGLIAVHESNTTSPDSGMTVKIIRTEKTTCQ